MSEKPPQGLTPRHTWEDRRLRAIGQAIARYQAEGKDVPREWASEQAELIAKRPVIEREES